MTAAQKPKILYVDDEPSNLTVFRSVFRRTFSVETAQSAAEGLAVIHRVPDLQVIVSDQRMPEMTGVQMLEKAREIRPDAIRILLTAYTDVNDIIDSINKGNVYKFITKPWNEEDLRLTIQRACETYQLMQQNKRLHEELLQAERLASVGKAATAIGHEIRNQLNFGLAAELIKNRCPEDETVLQYSQMIIDSREHILRILDDIRTFTKNDEATVAYTKERKCLRTTLEKVSAFARFDINLNGMTIIETYDDIGEVYCDHQRIMQVILNLLRNAGEASQPDGRIVIRLSKKEDQAIIQIIDEGNGIPPENLDRIWEPFFTTKGERGLGLGLDICKKIVADHGGGIECESQVGEGTSFTIRLPLHHVTQST